MLNVIKIFLEFQLTFMSAASFNIFTKFLFISLSFYLSHIFLLIIFYYFPFFYFDLLFFHPCQVVLLSHERCMYLKLNSIGGGLGDFNPLFLCQPVAFLAFIKQFIIYSPSFVCSPQLLFDNTMPVSSFFNIFVNFSFCKLLN